MAREGNLNNKVLNKIFKETVTAPKFYSEHYSKGGNSCTHLFILSWKQKLNSWLLLFSVQSSFQVFELFWGILSFPFFHIFNPDKKGAEGNVFFLLKNLHSHTGPSSFSVLLQLKLS